jgi:hypothetical protein
MTVPMGGEVMFVRLSGRIVDESRMKVDEEEKMGER